VIQNGWVYIQDNKIVSVTAEPLLAFAGSSGCKDEDFINGSFLTDVARPRYQENLVKRNSVKAAARKMPNRYHDGVQRFAALLLISCSSTSPAYGDAAACDVLRAQLASKLRILPGRLS
jgi:hypothetical protein